MKKKIKWILKKLNLTIMKYSSLEFMVDKRFAQNDINFLGCISDANIRMVLKYLPESKAQLRQDLFVLSELNFKKNGFFVEFGAADGKHLSNTYLLEKNFDWKGILAEPAKCWHKPLKDNRECVIDTDCVWKDTGSIITFNECESAELSTINKYIDADVHSTSRKSSKSSKIYTVETVSLTHLLKKHNAPKIIDYLSIDTEGSEFEILNNFDFESHKFRVITCEHNFTNSREKIYKLLQSKGYERRYKDFSLFDDWYILSEE